MHTSMSWLAVSLALTSLWCTSAISLASALLLPENTSLNHSHLDSLTHVNAIKNIIDFTVLSSNDLPAAKGADTDLGATSRLGNTTDQEGNVEVGEMAHCEPELRTVELDLPVEANTFFSPSCVRLRQCGGCCLSPLLTCRPTVTKIVKIKVLKAVAHPGNGRRSSNNSILQQIQHKTSSSYVQVEAIHHVKCDCGCVVQEEDCNATIHTYAQGECACLCVNKDDKDACLQQSHIKYWDNDSCACRCWKPLECGTGETFSHASCRCEEEEEEEEEEE